MIKPMKFNKNELKILNKYAEDWFQDNDGYWIYWKDGYTDSWGDTCSHEYELKNIKQIIKDF